jgi:phage baseplate assembly protein W
MRATPKRTDILGRDLLAVYRVTDGRYEDLDFDRETRWAGGQLSDLLLTEGVSNAVQAVINRIKTVKGELQDLGHPEYGSRHHELIGQPNTENNRNLVKLYIIQALGYEARIEKIHRADIVFDHQRAPDRVDIALTFSFIGVPVPQDLVVPFSFERTL